MDLEELKRIKKEVEEDIAEKLNHLQEVTGCRVIQAHSCEKSSFEKMLFPSTAEQLPNLEFHIHIVI